jgi:2-oxoglutarate dehydrogenase E2 component (dihydrolipoamide succinyltransferase)
VDFLISSAFTFRITPFSGEICRKSIICSMSIEIRVPAVGESISEVTLVKWHKKDKDWVERDEIIAELESEKATFEINAQEQGVLSIVAPEGENLKIGDLACTIDNTAPRPEGAASIGTLTETAPEKLQNQLPASTPVPETVTVKATPVAAAIMADKKIDPATLSPTGQNRKINKQDVLEALNAPAMTQGGRNERPEKMSALRRTISRRLVEAKNTTAMLTTFNEVDMGAIMDIRAKNKDKFKEAHGINLGFMSFFARACCFALQEWPAVNARIDGDQVIYHDFCDISIAVSAPKGLVVPVIRNAESMSMAELEKSVANLATKARDNKLTIEEMSGGTFTLTNGGVFGSLMSTPIINIPQSAILGMHKIQERPMVVNGKIEIRPMMYLALSYDHRIIDGRESVSFLVRVKELLEQPSLLLAGKDPVKALLQLP